MSEEFKSKSEVELPIVEKEKILEGVIDIGTYGLGYHILKNVDNLETVFNEGLLGEPWHLTEEEQEKLKGMSRKEKWFKGRKMGKNLVHFNAIGRVGSFDYFGPGGAESRRLKEIVKEHPNQQIKYTIWAQIKAGRPGVAILFDLDRFKEIDPSFEDHEHNAGLKHDTFRPHMMYKNKGDEIPIDEFGKPAPGDEYGFRLSSRVAPRLFKGIWVNKEENLQTVLDIMQKTGNFFPVYGEEGELLWPAQMTYEEVKQFVAGRDKDNPKE